MEIQKPINLGGYVTPAERQEKRKQYIKNNKKADWTSALLQAANVPPRLAQDVSKYYKPKTDQSPLFLLGGIGTGKTVTAICNLFDLARADLVLQKAPTTYLKNNLVYFITADDLILLAHSEIKGGDSGKVDALRTVKYLVLDDLGSNHSSDYSVALIDNLLSHRYNYLRATIVTSNFDIKTLGGKGYGRSVSRLTASCVTLPLHKNLRNP